MSSLGKLRLLTAAHGARCDSTAGRRAGEIAECAAGSATRAAPPRYMQLADGSLRLASGADCAAAKAEADAWGDVAVYEAADFLVAATQPLLARASGGLAASRVWDRVSSAAASAYAGALPRGSWAPASSAAQPFDNSLYGAVLGDDAPPPGARQPAEPSGRLGALAGAEGDWGVLGGTAAGAGSRVTSQTLLTAGCGGAADEGAGLGFPQAPARGGPGRRPPRPQAWPALRRWLRRW